MAERVAEAVELAARVLGPRAQRNAPLGARTTYRVGGPAALLLEIHRPEDLSPVVEARRRSGLPVLVVGRGSNLLVADRGFPGLAVVLGEGMATLEVDADGLVHAGASLSLPVLARRTVAAGRTGLEWAVGVPGTVGGAVRMNAGGHGSDIASSLCHARVADLQSGQVEDWDVPRLGLRFRHSELACHHLVLAATLSTHAGDRAEGERQLAEIVRWRRDNQPGGQNAGSVFVNPLPDSAGRLVDAAGLKGFRIGTAQVSTKHANFVQADDGGSADDVKALVDEVARRVRETHGVVLRPEVRLIGFEEGEG
jgi:UDP-N-acetylmuramate dehydrogenase